MRAWRVAAVAVLAGAFAVPATAVGSDGGRQVFSFRDPRITESSGLVDLGSMMVTTNDSGDSSRVFVVDPASGRTVGITDYHSEMLDAEALAPAGPGEVWVGDIGDNSRSRDEVTVYRVPVGERQIDVASPVRYRFTYPDGSHDAESLLVDRAGRIYLISKSPLGGTVYRAPATLSRSGRNRLTAVAEVADFATDAALGRGDRFVVVRGPAQASVYTFPGFRRVGTFALPHQHQKKKISIGPDGRVRISSEKAGTAVEQVDLPAGILRGLRHPATTPAGPPPEPEPAAAGHDGNRGTTLLAWSVAGVLVLGAVGLGLGLRRGSA